MASIFKRGKNKNNRKAPWLIQYTDHNGKRPCVTGFPDKALTEQLAAKLESEVRLRRKGLIDPKEEAAIERKNSPIDTHLVEFRKSISRGDNTEKHVKLTVGRIRRILDEASITKPAEIDFDSVEQVLREMVEQGEVGHKTYNHYLQAMDQFCKWLSHGQRKILPHNPISGMERLNTEVDVRHPRRALTQDEFRQLVDSALLSGVDIQCFDGFNRAKIYLISYFTGLRRKEIGSLTPASFDLETTPPTVTVEAACSKHRRRDTLPLHPELVSQLREWLVGYSRDEFLFPKLGKRRTWLMVKKDLERVGIPYETSEGIADFHAAGRHTHITELLKNGATLPQAKNLARHSDVRTTMRYTHIGIEDQAKAVTSLPSPTGLVGDQRFSQHLNGSNRPKMSSDDSEATLSQQPEDDESSGNDAVCHASAVAVAECPKTESGFDPRRLH